jgi:hypothetical protein
MKKITQYNGKYSYAIYKYNGKFYVSNEHGTRPATKKEIDKINKNKGRD